MTIDTGIDITDVDRLRRAIEKLGDDFLTRVFTKEELAAAGKLKSSTLHLAGRFAAKEAVFKAMGDAGLSWQDICVLNDESGKPYCRILNGKGAGADIRISISHTKDYAVATALVIKTP
ncbi:MAG TPA: holo-[acyl-carrier-protein] synthase [Elusimicrobia bacterium]|nr:holo-[acyl-carrier-protein] synthase [Elusimicrobiota bacterium]